MENTTLGETLVQIDPDIVPIVQEHHAVENALTNEVGRLQQEIDRLNRERNDARAERQRRYEENNPPKEMTLQLILWRMTHSYLLNDLLHLAMLYAYCTLDNNIMNDIVSRCILIKIVLWFFPFFIRIFVQPYIDYKKIGQSFRPKEMNQFTIISSKAIMAYHIFNTVVFLFADIIIINQFIPVQNSCDPYPINMCVIQKTYSIICITTYSLILACVFAFLGALIAPSIKTKLNELTYALNVAGLQHLTIDENDEDKECAICFEVMKEATGLPCGHKFCDKCVQPWIKEKGKCPTCSQPAFSKKTTDLHVYGEGHKYVEEKQDEQPNLHPMDQIV